MLNRQLEQKQVRASTFWFGLGRICGLEHLSLCKVGTLLSLMRWWNEIGDVKIAFFENWDMPRLPATTFKKDAGRETGRQYKHSFRASRS